MENIAALFEYIQANYDSTSLKQNRPLELSVTSGRRYIRVVRDNSAWGFIDKENGDIYKAASWKTPAKHARGNINDKSSWNAFTWCGPQYL